MLVFMACAGPVIKGYDGMEDRFVHKRVIPELRSYYELLWFKGHTLPIIGEPFMLDSGAFSAWSQGTEIDIKKYAAFIKKYSNQIDYYINLDSIPKSNSEKALIRAAEETLENQKYLEGEGLHPLPVFHKGEPFRFLEYYLSKGYDYLCLGGLTVGAKDSNKAFFDLVFSKYLTDSKGYPTLKIHGFGMTSFQHMTTYPFYSTDSSSWLIMSRLGMISVPYKLNQEYDYTRKPFTIAVSDKAGARKYHGYHLDTLAEGQRKHIFEYLKLKNVKVDDLRGELKWRAIINLYYWLDMQEHLSFPKTFRKQQTTLL